MMEKGFDSFVIGVNAKRMYSMQLQNKSNFLTSVDIDRTMYVECRFGLQSIVVVKILLL